MLNKEKISITDFDNKLYQEKYAVTRGGDKAILTHYLHNLNSAEEEFYKPNFSKIVENYRIYKGEKGENVSAEEIEAEFLAEISNAPYFTRINNFTFIDLFAGVGGFRLAMQNLGGKCIFSSEWNENAQETYTVNFGETPFGDITKQEVKDFIPQHFDILCAGFPCQPFSIAGCRKGFNDVRGTLFFDIEQIAEKHRPKVIFLENVKNLVAHDQGNTFRTIINILEKKLGYKVYYEVLNAMTHANVPQNRERIFIVAFDPERIEDHTHFEFPAPIPFTSTIHDFIDEEQQAQKYYYAEEHKYYPELERTMTSRDSIYQWRRIYVRENKSNVCPTLTANMGMGGHNVPLIRDNFGIRKLTPKECFAFQGYPIDEYILPPMANSKLYLQAGNSVTVPLIQRISEKILEIL